jgi:adenylate cyclase, class 2
MKEIEVKAKIMDKKVLVQKLAALGCRLSEPSRQKDRIFVPNGLTVPVPNGTSVLRIREQDGKQIFTFKRPLTNQLDCIERELGIDGAEALAEIFGLLGFYESSRVSKQRQKGKYKDLEICVDTVEELGNYIEVEKLSEDADSEKVQRELFEFLKTLGVREEDRVHDGYDVLMYKLKHA